MQDIPLISVIIPNLNGSATLDRCLEAACSSDYRDFEVIVVDDHSSDGSVGIIKSYPVRLIELESHGGASAARNAGARAARGEALFFIDADCVVAPDTLQKAASAFREHPAEVTGGTYTPIPYDKGFFSAFQSIYINHSETHSPEPDYIATHAMVIGREVFERSGGFKEDFMPILEDVELSHRLKKMGVNLIMRPEIEVRHIFNFTALRSLKNAYRKSRYWVRYSVANRDLLANSGTASIGLKAMAACTLTSLALFLLGIFTGSILILLLPPLPLLFGLIFNAGIIEAFFRHGGPVFGLMAVPYYTLVYPLAAAAGGVSGLIDRLRGN
jgi:GT2 family glycosyltransferase